MASARMERAEFPVHKNRTLYRLLTTGISIAAGKIDTARRAIARLLRRLAGTKKRAHKLVLYDRANPFRVESRRFQKFPRLFHLVNPRWVHLNRVESRRIQLLDVLGLLKRASDATHPQLHALANFRRHFAAQHH